MRYTVFEGRKDVRKPKLKTDREVFDRLRINLGFSREINLVEFCTSIALRIKQAGGNIEIVDSPKLQKMVDISYFENAEIYDIVISEFMGVKTGRMEEFERLFYAGFRLLKGWDINYGAEATSVVERFTSVWNNLIENQN